ncbi:MAG: ATP-binding protein [Candidatus Bipolaricaulia bacterium]
MRDSNGNYHVYRGRTLTTIAKSERSIGAPLLRYGPKGQRWRTTGQHLYRKRHRVFSAGTLINALRFDHQGNIWVGTYRNGLYRLRPSPATTYGVPEGLPSNNVYTVHEPPSDPGMVWVGTLRGGLARIDISTGTVDASPLGIAQTLSVVWTVWKEEGGRLWIGGEGLRYVEDGRLRTQGLPDTLHAPPPYGPPRGGPSKRVRVFYEDNSGRLWVGSEVGLFRREDDGTWTRFGPAQGVPESIVRVIEQVDNGALWMGTKGAGLRRYRGGTFQPVTTADGLSSNLIRSLHEGADGYLWVGTEGEGLCRIDRRGTVDLGDDRIDCLEEEDGLFDDVIHAILPDGQGRLWMSSNRGIFWVKRTQLIAAADGRLEAVDSHGYTEADDLRNREANGGGQPAAVRTTDGRLWFSTQGGVVVFDPSRLDRDRAPPPVAIEHLAVGDSTIRMPGAETASIRLAPGQRTFDVEFTGLNLREPRAASFRYRLRGFDSWQTVEDQRRAHYTDVSPGTYTFEVKAASEEGNWSRKPARLTLTIAPHWWETTWFYLLCGLALLGLGGGAYRWRVRRLEKRQEALEDDVAERTQKVRRQRDQIEAQAEKLRELDEVKSRFFANVSHEFRTPLTLILGPLRDLRTQLSVRWREQLDLVERNAQRLHDLVERLLGIARMDAGTYRLNAQPIDLGAEVRRVARRFEPLAERKELTLTVNVPSGSDSTDGATGEADRVYADPEGLEHIVGNLLSNAIKFTPEGGRVEVSGVRAADYVEIVVADTGPGIPQEQQAGIFDRFTQPGGEAEPAKQDGVGIGLAFVQDLVDLNGGTVSVESTPGEGATFTVRLPRGREHLAEEHLAADEERTPSENREERGAPEFPRPGPDRGAEGRTPNAPPTAFPPAADRESEDLEQGADRMTVLVVDDNPDLRTYLRSVLTPDFRVVEAADGREGCVRAMQGQPDCILVDAMMPETRGTEMVRRLRANRSTECIPIIMLTARAGTEEEVEGLSAGADDYVTKPFDPEVLRARVFGQIERRRRLRRRVRAELRDGSDAPRSPEDSPFRSSASGTRSGDGTDPPELKPPALEPPQMMVPIKPNEEEPTFVRKVRRAVEENLADPDLTVEEVAGEVATSRSTLYRRLKDETGQTPSQFIRQVRVEHGARLLRRGAGTVSEVAYAVGFNSLSYFGESFRKHVGVSPSEYAEKEA